MNFFTALTYNGYDPPTSRVVFQLLAIFNVPVNGGTTIYLPQIYNILRNYNEKFRNFPDFPTGSSEGAYLGRFRGVK